MTCAKYAISNARLVRDNRYHIGPDADIAETTGEYTLSLEIPGTFKDDIKIWLEGDVLQVSGEKKAPSKGDERVLVSERAFGRFERSFILPVEVERNKISAQFVDGLLVITVPKSIEAKPREISIN